MENIGIYHYIFVCCALVAIGIFGLMTNRRNIIAYILSIEISFLGICLLFISIGSFLQNIRGHAFLIFVFAVTAAEATLIISAIIFHYKKNGEISVDSIEKSADV